MLQALMNHSCTDLLMMNSPITFQNWYVVETGLFGLYKTTIRVMKTTFVKLKVIDYRDYDDFGNFCCMNCQQKMLISILLVQTIFEDMSQCPGQIAPRKEQQSWGNNMSFVNKALIAIHMT